MEFLRSVGAGFCYAFGGFFGWWLGRFIFDVFHSIKH